MERRTKKKGYVKRFLSGFFVVVFFCLFVFSNFRNCVDVVVAVEKQTITAKIYHCAYVKIKINVDYNVTNKISSRAQYL